MERRYTTIYSPAIGRDMPLLTFGHYGAPLIAFPSGGGQFHDFEDNGMIRALAPLIDSGKIKVYCPASLDNETWLSNETDPHWRGVWYGAYIDFILNNLVPHIRYDCQSADIRIGLVGCSLGAYHAANLTLKFPDLFHYGLCMSGRYDLNAIMGQHSDSKEVYFNNPAAYLYNIHGDELNRIKHNAHLALVCGQGAWEEKCLAETWQLTNALERHGISHECDIWGHDVEHHWHWWRKQVTYHLEKTFGQ